MKKISLFIIALLLISTFVFATSTMNHKSMMNSSGSASMMQQCKTSSSCCSIKMNNQCKSMMNSSGSANTTTHTTH